MGLMKINSILKKYKALHKKHKDSWNESQERIRKASLDGYSINETAYQKESYNFHLKGNNLFSQMIKELENQQVFKND